MKAARPDQTGGFSIAGLPVGSYLCVALEYLEPGQETDPEFLRSIAPLATAIKLAESEKKALTLRLTER